MSANSEHSVLTVGDLLELPAVQEAEVSVAAAPHRLGNRVEWVHVFETPAIAGMLRGGEFLLTTGIALAGMPAGEVDALVAGAARSGAAGIGFEPSHAPVDALAASCRRHELPLLVFGKPVRFVDITHVVQEQLVASELATLRRAVSLQAQLREAAREGLGPAGLVAALGDALNAQVLLERFDRTPIAASPEDGLDVAFMDALDRRRQRLPTPLLTRAVNPGARLHVLARIADELDSLAVDEASFLLSVALASQPPGDEEPSAERARLLQRLAEGRAGTASDVVRRARSVGVDLSRATLWAVRSRGSLAQLERLGVDALVDGDTALVAMRGDDDPWALARDLVRRGAGAIGIDSRGGEPWQVRDALAGAQRACLVAAATATPVRHGSELGALGGVARDVLAGDRVDPRFSESEAHLVESLVATGWSKSAAARRMRISRQRLYERLSALAARHRLDPDLPQTRVELSLEIWALRMAELAHG